MRRRDFITLLSVAAAALPLAALAQPGMRRLGVLLGNTEGDPQAETGLAAFRQGLQELGWVEGRNFQLDLRWGRADVDRIQAMADELVGLHPDVILAQSTPTVGALQRASKTIPVVFLTVSDPIGSGFIASLSRPGGNITGFINVEASLSGKWIELLKDIVPGLARAAFLFNPETAPYFEYYLAPFETAARSFGIEPIKAPVRNVAEIEKVIAALADRPHTGLAVMPDTFMARHSNVEFIVALTSRYRIPTVYPYRFMVAPGGLLSYGVDVIDLYRRAPTYIDRILKGASPADLPVQLPTKFEMAINLKTARALGIEMPATLLGRADEVIE